MHESWQAQLPFYVARTLPAPERAALEQHLRTCEQCQQALELWQQTAQAVRQQAEARPLPESAPPLVRPAPVMRQSSQDAPPLIAPPGPPSRARSNGSRQRLAAQPAGRRIRLPAGWAVAVLTLIFLAGGLTWIARYSADDPETGSVPAQAQPTSPAPTLPPDTAPDGAPSVTLLDLDRISFEQQTWNNAGPATLAMALSYWGWEGDQETISRVLRPDGEDKSTSPGELAWYAETYADRLALDGFAGTLDLLEGFITAGYPVIVRTGFELPDQDWLGHYRLVVGYDAARREFILYDSYLGRGDGDGLRISETELDRVWEHFNRRYVVIHPAGQASRVQEIVDTHEGGALPAMLYARTRTDDDPTDMWAWLNLGANYLALDMYEEAAAAYDRALALDYPWRLLWYRHDVYEAYFRADSALCSNDADQTVLSPNDIYEAYICVGRTADLIALAQSALETTPHVEETQFWLAMAYARQGDLGQSVAHLERLRQLNPNLPYTVLGRTIPGSPPDDAPAGDSAADSAP